MAPPTTFSARARSFRNRSGFTLIELLVVIMIIVLLASVLVPMVLRAQKVAKKTRTAADLQSISVGLAAYHADFGDYPRVDDSPYIANVGFAVLCKALIGPAPAGGLAGSVSAVVQTPAGGPPYLAGTYTSTGTWGQPGYLEYVCFGVPLNDADLASGYAASLPSSDTTTWQPFAVRDGLDGPGFRVRTGGKPYPGYLQAEKFNVRGMAMHDLWGRPILYFPGRPAKPAQTNNWPLLIGAGSLYNANDNLSFFLRPGETLAANANNALKRMDAVIVKNSINFDGMVQTNVAPGTPPESAATTGDFLLWSAGPDGRFGANITPPNTNPVAADIDACDDVTNFR